MRGLGGCPAYLLLLLLEGLLAAPESLMLLGLGLSGFSAPGLANAAHEIGSRFRLASSLNLASADCPG